MPDEPTPAPDAAPAANGTIVLEWIRSEGPFLKLYIDIGPGRFWTAFWRKPDGEKCTLPHQAIDGNTPKIIQSEILGS